MLTKANSYSESIFLEETLFATVAVTLTFSLWRRKGKAFCARQFALQSSAT